MQILSENIQKKHYEDNRLYYIKKAERCARKIRDYIRKLKTENPCLDCGRYEHFCAMDYDHVRGIKKYEIARAYNFVTSIESLKKELSKCKLVCAVCHRKRTFKRSSHRLMEKTRDS